MARIDQPPMIAMQRACRFRIEGQKPRDTDTLHARAGVNPSDVVTLWCEPPARASRYSVMPEDQQESSDRPTSIDGLAALNEPFVLADALGNVVSVNDAFRRTYGWRDEQLVGQPLGMILPESFRMSHQLGFSRYQATEQSTILAHPLRLATRCADGRDIVSEHFIVGEKRSQGWLFGATLIPLPDGTPTDA